MKVVRIRITILRTDGRFIDKTFTDVQVAANWLVQDSYFSESYTKSVHWEQFDY